jgi:hypothetical protein
MDPEQTKHIATLLFPPYWRAEALDIVKSAVDAGYTLDQIAYALTRYGADALIMSTYSKPIHTVEWAARAGPYTGPRGVPIIVFGYTWFGV